MERDYIHGIDKIRKREYPLLANTTYLDHAGTTLYSRSMVKQFSNDLCSHVFGNPHSASPSSTLSTQRIEKVRSRVLDFFKADPEHFDVVFVANATAAIKMVMHAFQDCASRVASHNQPGFWYGYHGDAHTSLVGVRQMAFAGSKCFSSDDEVEDWLSGKLDITKDGNGCLKDPRLGLFAYPAQSNMNGHRLPLNWAGRLRSSRHPTHKNIYTMLDAAAYVSSAQLDLSDADMAPDFTALSFYKIFGFPDLGALIVRKKAGHILQQRLYFGGGTVDMVIAVDIAWHAKKDHKLHEELEDGTLPFHNIIALDAAFDTHKRLYGSMTRISAHVCYLAKRLYDGLRSLRHYNGLPVCEIYKHPASIYGNSETQAPTIALNLRNSQAGWVGKTDVEQLAIVRGIQLRTGGVCNPGGIATYLSLKPWEMRRNFTEGVRCGNDFDVMGGKPTGIVRVSLGAMSNMRDVQHFLCFVSEVFVETTQVRIPPLEPSLLPQSQDSIQSIQICPIRGAKSWKIPKNTPWEVKEVGLAFEREWCVVSTINGEVLTSDYHPELVLLQPSLHLEEGFLKIAFPMTSNASIEPAQAISVSLWENPPANLNHPLFTTTRPLPTPYPDKTIADFFTSFFAFPCTLARYPDHRRAIAGQAVSAPAVSQLGSTTAEAQACSAPTNKPACWAHNFVTDPRLEDTITFSISNRSDFDPASNIYTTNPATLAGSSWQYIRIGPHYFRSLHDFSSDTARVSQSIRHLRYLRSRFDINPAAQYPTIRVGDIVQTFTAGSSAENAGLRACIASSGATEFTCPVPACRKELATKEEKIAHLLVHRVGPTASLTSEAVTVIGRLKYVLSARTDKKFTMSTKVAGFCSVRRPMGGEREFFSVEGADELPRGTYQN